jgi:hypothetical protein
MTSTEEFDDPFKSLSSSNLEDLALGNIAADAFDIGFGGDDGGDANFKNNAMTHDMDMVHSDEQQPPPITASDEGDPWAVLAAAAGEATDESDAIPSSASTATTVLAHSEGESFAMPNANAATSSSTSTSSIIGQIRSSTAHLLHEVDSKTGISSRARIVDDQLHISEKWTNFHSHVLLPTTTKTKEIVHDKIAPTVKEHWSTIQQRTSEMGVKERMANVSSAVGQTWHETTSRVGHWREEQEMKRALANARNESLYGDAAGSSPPSSSLSSHEQRHHHQFQQNLDGAKEKVVEGWNWLSQRIHETKLRQQQRQQPQPSSGGDGVEDVVPDNRNSEMRHMDSDGMPSSFRKD